MRTLRWVGLLLVALLVGAFLHYVLPKRAVVYVTGVENRIVSPDEVRGFRSLGETTTDAQGRAVSDVFFINTIQRSGGPLVFRNEDTGFGFPFYFKFDSANLQAEAQDAISATAAGSGDPRWVIMRYYGWRVPFLSMFPNAVSLELAPSRDVRLIPWFNIVLLTLLIAAVWAVAARVRRWSRRRRERVATGWETPGPTRRGWFR